jgi:hypothetical protein
MRNHRGLDLVECCGDYIHIYNTSPHPRIIDYAVSGYDELRG